MSGIDVQTHLLLINMIPSSNPTTIMTRTEMTRPTIRPTLVPLGAVREEMKTMINMISNVVVGSQIHEKPALLLYKIH